MGKSLFIARMADKLTEYQSTGMTYVTVPIHGPEVTPDIVMERLKDYMKETTSTIFHLDIAPSVSYICMCSLVQCSILSLPSLFQILWKVDTILFCLLVLRGLSDSQGRVWRCYPTQLYTIEVTLPEHPQLQVQLKLQHAYIYRWTCLLNVPDIV